MIYTVTLNPSIDYIMHVDAFKEGGLNRATKTYYYPGGKGINVSRVLSKLDISTTALGFIGGFTGQFIQEALEQAHVNHNFINTGQKTRINVKLKSSDESEINGPGPEITNDQQHELLQQVDQLSKGDFLVVAGSIPKTMPPSFYKEMAKRCEENEAHFVADTSGEALEDLIGTKTFLLKPNHHELGELFQTTIETKEDAIYHAKKLMDKSADNVIVSMGGDGAILVNHEYTLFANVPKGEVKNSVGAGDSVVSGFLAGYEKTQDVKEAFAYGVAAGSATAFSDDLAEAEYIHELREQVNVEVLS